MDASKSRNASNICTLSAAWIPSNCMVASNKVEACNSKDTASKQSKPQQEVSARNNRDDSISRGTNDIGSGTTLTTREQDKN
jgi:hypothetical protein